MATTKHVITGKSMWAKVFEHNAETNDHVGEPYPWEKTYKITLVLDKENRQALRNSKSAIKGKVNEDTFEFRATFKRKHKDRFESAGGPPQVLNADDTPFEGKIIPNGSLVEVVYEVYTTSMANGTRMISVKILELAEMPEREEPKKEAPPVQPKRSELDAEIPF